MHGLFLSQTKKVLNESGFKQKKIYVDKGNAFYNTSVQSWLQGNNLDIYSTQNEKKIVFAERFSRILTH